MLDEVETTVTDAAFEIKFRDCHLQSRRQWRHFHFRVTRLFARNFVSDRS
jgi:hypothetical protein